MRRSCSFAAIMVGWTFAVIGSTSLQAQTIQQNDGRKPQPTTMPSQSSTEQGVKLTIECPSELVSGAENYVTMTVRNEGEIPVKLFAEAPQALGVGFEVMQAGQAVQMTSLGARKLVESPMSSGRMPIVIGKDQELRVVVNLTRYYDLSLTGEFQIAAVWSGMVARKGFEPIRIRTKPLNFKVIVKPGESESWPEQKR